jgi:hypothetical protein
MGSAAPAVIASDFYLSGKGMRKQMQHFNLFSNLSPSHAKNS